MIKNICGITVKGRNIWQGNPLSLVKSTECKVWLDGQDTSQFSLNGNKVIQWDCKGTLAAHVLNTIDAQRPTYDANTGRVTFITGDSTFLQSAAFGAALTQPNTVFIVYKITDEAGTKYVFDAIAHAAQLFYYVTDFRLHAGTSILSEQMNTNDNIHAGLFNGASSEYWINGASVGTGNVGAGILDGITLGAGGNLTNNSNVEIMEAIVYNADITNAERIAVTVYLKNKWNLTY